MANAREKYAASQRNQAAMRQVEALLLRESRSVLSIARNFARQELGGYLRSVVPALVDRFGNINAAAALRYYEEQRAFSLSRVTLNPGPANRSARNSARSRADRFAQARLEAEIYRATLPQFNVAEISEPIIGYGMSEFADKGFDAMDSSVRNAMTRAVASYNRDTILYNSAIDPAVVRVQRVAEPGACAFCRLMAFTSYRSTGVRTAEYAIDFHNNCRCSIETLYEGDEPIVPEYYKEFEENYVAATRNVGTRNARDVISEMQRLART